MRHTAAHRCIVTLTEAQALALADGEPEIAQAVRYWQQHDLFRLSPPIALEIGGTPVSVMFHAYVRLTLRVYWQVTLQHARRQGHGRTLWANAIARAWTDGMRRVWLLAAPASAPFHAANGLLFVGAVAETGYLISEQDMMPDIPGQHAYRTAVLRGDIRLDLEPATLARVEAGPHSVPASVTHLYVRQLVLQPPRSR